MFGMQLIRLLLIQITTTLLFLDRVRGRDRRPNLSEGDDIAELKVLLMISGDPLPVPHIILPMEVGSEELEESENKVKLSKESKWLKPF